MTATRRAAGLVPALLLPLVAVACGGAAPVDPELDRLRAENAAAQGRWDWARLYYRRDLDAHPDRLGSLRGEGFAWLSGYQQSASRGAEVLERYLDARPDDGEARRRLVSVLLLLGERERAAARAAGLDASPEAELLRAEVFLESDPAAAREAVERAVAAAPESGRAHLLLARLAERDDPSAALTHAREAVHLAPMDAESRYVLARLARREDRDLAVEALAVHELLRRLQHDGTLAPLAPTEELAVLDALEPRLGAVPFALERRRLSALFRAGRLADASDLLTRLADDPRATLADLRDMAVEAGDAGRRGLARGLFERVLAASPDERGATASLAVLDLDEGDLGAARRRLEAGLAAHPGFARYHLLLGRVARAEGDADQARRLFERAVELAPWEPAWRGDLADLLTAMGEGGAARAVREAAPEPREGAPPPAPAP